MPAKYFEFVDGQRLPGNRVKEFIMNQCVIQCENQTEITGSGIEAFGARVAMNLEDGQIWTYAGEPAAWAPAQNALDLDLLDARYLTRLAADGLYLTETQADQKYLTILTAQGLYITEGQADGKYLTPAQANALYLTPLDADSRYITLVAAGQIYLRKDDADTDFQKKPTTGTFITDIQAGSIYLSQTTASSTYLTQLNAGTLYLAKGNAASDINNNSTTIDGGKITTNSINVNRLVAGTLTGFRVQTSSSGQRVVMSESTNSLVFFNSSNTEIGRITGLASFNYDTGTTHAFQVNGSTVFSVNASGIALSPGEEVNSNLPVNGTVTATGGVTGSFVRAGTSGSTLNSGGQVTVATFSTTTLAGNVRGANGDQLRIPSSDARIKSEIEQIPDGLNVVNQLNPVTFNSLIDDTDRRIPGFIAQDLEQVFDENTYIVDKIPVDQVDLPVDLGDDPLRTIEVTHLIPYLTKAIQELSAKNDALEARIAALEGGVA